MFTADDVLPDGAVLVHVGPFKTGTTAIQTALEDAKKQLRELGIFWATSDRRRVRAGIATLTGGTGPYDHQTGVERWARLRREVAAAADERVVISSEFLSEADAEVSRRIAADLGGDRVHVVVTLRPLSAVCPSQWQQFAQAGRVSPYEEWLRVTLETPAQSARFWLRHDQAALVERWAAAVGASNVCAIVLDESDRTAITRGFEHLLRLPSGFLVPRSTGGNRSLTYGEVELVRAMNEVFAQRAWSEGFYDALMRRGAVAGMLENHRPGPEEPRLTTPKWALDRIREIGEDAASRIEQLGIHVIGDLAGVAALPAYAEHGTPPDPGPPVLAMNSAFHAVLGAIEGSRVTEAKEPPTPLRGKEAKVVRRRTERRVAKLAAAEQRAAVPAERGANPAGGAKRGGSKAAKQAESKRSLRARLRRAARELVGR
jgi:hypothetical protein